MNDVQPITHGGVDRGYKLCRCVECKEESVCTPSNDFYTIESDTGPLHCEKCMLKRAKTRASS